MASALALAAAAASASAFASASTFAAAHCAAFAFDSSSAFFLASSSAFFALAAQGGHHARHSASALHTSCTYLSLGKVVDAGLLLGGLLLWLCLWLQLGGLHTLLLFVVACRGLRCLRGREVVN